MSYASGNSTANPQNPAVTPVSGPVGRFAPSPSGPLHFGSLLTALASFLHARNQSGRWLLRIDDLDAPRTTIGSEDAIRRTLEAHELLWDGTPTRQSEHLPAYQQALVKLAQKGLLFFCTCSRKSLKGKAAYPGVCRDKRCSETALAAHLRVPAGQHTSALRLKMPCRELQFSDQLLGEQKSHLTQQGGDYIVLRRDGLVSYQLAVVIDDALTGITQVVRGADLLPTTARQQHLHELLGYSAPSWMHLPIVLNQRHSKLSKQAHSKAVTDAQPAANLNIALQLLGQQPPTNSHRWTPAQLVDWAVLNWATEKLPARESFNHFYGW